MATQNPVSCIRSYREHSITRKQVHYLCINMFHYPPEYRDTLEAYWIYHWSGKLFTGKLTDGTIDITDIRDEGVNTGEYNVVYQDCTPYVAKRAHELRLSFRKPLPEFGIPAYVIVRVTKENVL